MFVHSPPDGPDAFSGNPFFGADVSNGVVDPPATDHTASSEERAFPTLLVRILLIPLFAHSIRPGLIRRSIALVLLLVLGGALSGCLFVPVSPKSSPRSSDQRFPCEACPCGCSTAEFCWDKCCCFNDEEKLRWADENGVTPPPFLVRRVAQRRAELADSTVVPKSGESCCCCGSKSSGDDSRCTAAIDDDNDATRIVLWWKAAECRGLSWLWTFMADLGSDPPTMTRSDVALVYWMTLSDQSAESIIHLPDPPVPWC
ncbi:hypothetical protein [Crateriforma spongiae]|uniref:hypothetical protein n=1 Tax=Crateriforma spongiae TaxID=2724528 RepID=UPI00144639C1|nr:hypothetical protein [Crateriforma spongiae]